MRLALPSLLLLSVGTAAHAQLSVTPQIGLENSQVSLSTNNSSFSSLGSALAPRASVRLDYRFKKAHGPYVGFGTSPGITTVSTANPEAIMSNYSTTTGSPKLRLEAGYGFSTKPINLQKPSFTTETKTVTRQVKTRCGTYSKTYQVTTKKKNDTWNMRIQPSAGIAYTPAKSNGLVTQQDATGTVYQYKAGNWNTAVTTGVGFAFAKGAQQKFAVGLNYLRGIGNLGEQSLSTASEGKTSVNQLQSRASAWSLSFGIPFTLTKQKQEVKLVKAQQQKKSTHKSKCGASREYKRCGSRSYSL
jgi:hypothetical protein